MIKFNVIYPFQPGMRFDHDYYRDTHMPLLAKRLGAVCRSYTIDKGVAGRAPADQMPFAAACSVYCESVEAFRAALAPHSEEIRADVRNYTDVQPLVWFSEVVA
jgi:uncharacterized protein (TIGR02118 family)